MIIIRESMAMDILENFYFLRAGGGA